jgi:hypothetical protein
MSLKGALVRAEDGTELHTEVLWDMMPSNVVCTHQHSRGISYFHLQGSTPLI